MNTTENRIDHGDRRIYESPIAQTIALSAEDILTSSSDSNLGEWDSQENLLNYKDGGSDL